MGSLFIILARILIVSPIVVPAVLAGLDYTSASAAFAEAYPQLKSAFPAILGVKALFGLVVVLGLPLHRVLSVLLAAAVVFLATVEAPFYNVIGDERALMQSAFMGMMAQAGGLLLIAVMPKRS